MASFLMVVLLLMLYTLAVVDGGLSGDLVFIGIGALGLFLSLING